LERQNLKAHFRETRGNSPARALRRQGMIPAVLYGRHAESRMFSINVHELQLIVNKSAARQVFVNLETPEGPPTFAMLKELQRHPVSGNYLHADFYEVDMNRKIRVMVQVVPTGKAIGVEEGGMLQIIRRQVEVLCLPNAIPETIEMDISHLNMGESLHVTDLPLPDGVEIPHGTNFTVVTVLSGRMAGEAESEVAEGEAAEEPESESEG
jgi:large subunit ribosomal protein L25